MYTPTERHHKSLPFFHHSSWRLVLIHIEKNTKTKIKVHTRTFSISFTPPDFHNQHSLTLHKQFRLKTFAIVFFLSPRSFTMKSKTVLFKGREQRAIRNTLLGDPHRWKSFNLCRRVSGRMGKVRLCCDFLEFMKNVIKLE